MSTDYKNTMMDEAPAWLLKKGQINEPMFCEMLLGKVQLRYVDDAFYSVNGAVDEQQLTSYVCNIIKDHVKTGTARKAESIVHTLELICYQKELPVSDKEIHLRNGVLCTDGTFSAGMRFCRNRLNVCYDPGTPSPDRFLRFLSDMLEPDDILTLQEYLGYCLIPTTTAQKALFLIGNGGEGKSCVGAVVKSIFGDSAVTGNFQAIETDKFSRYKLINKLVMIDDDMQMTALPSTGIIKNLITSKIPVEVEAKGQQSRQVSLYSRFICLGNGSPRALYDKSDGFTRRMLILTTKSVSKDRVIDPDLTSKLTAEKEGIFVWMFAGLKRLIANNYEFTLSDKSRANLNELASENCNIAEYLTDSDYITFGDIFSATSNDLYGGYSQWCGMNGLTALRQDTFTNWLKCNSQGYGIKYSSNVLNRDNRHVRGFRGIKTSFTPFIA